MSARRALAVGLYMPLILGLLALAAFTGALLLRRQPAGLYGIPYALAALALGNRVHRIGNGEVPDEQLKWDLLLTTAADILLAVIVAARAGF